MFNKNNNNTDCFAQYGNLKNKFEQQFGKIRNEFSREHRPLVNIEENKAFLPYNYMLLVSKKNNLKLK